MRFADLPANIRAFLPAQQQNVRLGDLFYWYRKRRGWSVEVMALQVGTSTSTISTIERNLYKDIKIKLMLKLCAAIQLTPDTFCKLYAEEKK